MLKLLKPVDASILNFLQSNGKLTMKQLGLAVFLSASAAGKRVNKLKKRGYITGYNAQIGNLAPVDKIFSMNLVQLKSNSGDNIERFKRKAAEIRSIVSCDHTLGICDFFVKIGDDDINEHGRILEQEFLGFEITRQTFFILN